MTWLAAGNVLMSPACWRAVENWNGTAIKLRSRLRPPSV